jgi:hypothetical protein
MVIYKETIPELCTDFIVMRPISIPFVIYLDRLVQTRKVLKDIYTQLDGLDDFFSERQRLLGKPRGENDREFLTRSQDINTHTFELSRDDYVNEVEQINSMKWDLDGFMAEIRDLYWGMMESLMKKDASIDRLEDADTKDSLDTVLDIIDVDVARAVVHHSELGPKLSSKLNAIALQICDVLFEYDKKNHFEIHNRSALYKSLCSNVFPTIFMGSVAVASHVDGIQRILKFYDSIALNITSMNELEQQYFDSMDLTNVYQTRVTVDENTYIVFGRRIWSPASLHDVIHLKKYETYMGI